MSYNITSWRINALRLELPLGFDFQRWLQGQPDRDAKGYENTGKRWCLGDKDCRVLIDQAAQTWELTVLGMGLKGIVAECLDTIEIVDWTGDCSGILYHDVLIPLFKEFKGSMSVLVVWEGGDTISQVTILDGIVEETEI